MIDENELPMVVLDIETATARERPDPNLDAPVFVGFRSANGRRVMYHISEKDAIQNALSYFPVVIGHNIKGYDQPILERWGFKFKTNDGKYQIIIDTLDISKKRLKTMMYIDLHEQSMSLGKLAEMFNLSCQKGEMDYSILKQKEWSEEEYQEIQTYLFGDLDTTWELFVYYYDFFHGLKRLMKEKDQTRLAWLTTSSGSCAYKIICNKAGLKEEYTDEAEDDIDTIRYEGAFVALPYGDFVEGDLHCFDFASLYPHMFMMGNLYSQTTDVDNAWHGGKIYLPKEAGEEDGIVGYYNRGEMGVIEKTLKEIFDERMMFREQEKMLPEGFEKKTKTAQVLANKIVINTSYGISGSPRFKNVFNVITAADCTAMARISTKYARKVFTEEGYECMYTDSVTHNNTIMFWVDGLFYEMNFAEFQKFIINDIQHIRETPGNGVIRYILQEEVLTPTVNPITLHTELKPIEYLYAHPPKNKTVTVTHKSKKGDIYVGVTEDHSMIEYEDGRLIEKPPREIKKMFEYQGLTHPPFRGEYDDWFTFLGLLCVSGVVDAKTYRIFLKMANTRESSAMKKILIPVVRKRFPNTIVETDDINIVLMNKELHMFVIENGFHKMLTIPESILDESIENRLGFLRGIVTRCLQKTNSGQMALEIYGVENAKIVKKIFGSFGIHSDMMLLRTRVFRLSIPSIQTSWIRQYVGSLLPDSIHKNWATREARDPALYNRKVTSVQPYNNFNNQVYDLGIKDNHNFFANGVLVHNTDSVYLKDNYNDIDRLKAVARRITQDLIDDANIKIDTMSLEHECAIKHMYFFRDDENNFVKKYYAYLTEKKGQPHLVEKGLKIVKGDCSALGRKTYLSQIKPLMMLGLPVIFTAKEIIEMVADEFRKSPELMSKRFRLKGTKFYFENAEKRAKKDGTTPKHPTSIHFSLSEVYGSCEIFLYPNQELGVGKQKKYATKEEMENHFGKNWVKKIDFSAAVKDLKSFIVADGGKRNSVITKAMREYLKGE